MALSSTPFRYTSAAPARAAGVSTGSTSTSVTFGSTDDVMMLVYGKKWGGGAGQSASLTYSYLDLGISQYLSSYDSNNTPFTPNTVRELTSAETTAVANALARWSAVANVTFSKVLDTKAGNNSTAGTLRFGVSSAANPTAYAYLPGGEARAGDVWLGTATSDFGVGTYGYFQVLHEIGHALGLKHPHDPNRSSTKIYDATSRDHLQWTIMSYKDYEGDGRGNSNGMSHSYYPTTPMIADIAAIQYLYGANTSHRTGNDTYSWARGATVFETIWDAGGSDTISWSNQSSAATINLTAGTYSAVGPNITWRKQNGGTASSNARLGIALGVTIENAKGGSAGDTINGNDVNNVLWGYDGADTLNGSAGADVLWGGTGADTLNGGSHNDTLNGGIGNDVLIGGDGNDTLGVIGSDAEDGNDTIDGGDGNDSINAGAGNDWVSGGYGFDSMNGGAGIDTLSYDFYANSNGMHVSLASGSASFLTGGSEYFSNFENVVGGGGHDYIVGNNGDNVLSGGNGNDVLDGSFGFDTLNGGAGTDTADFYFYRDSNGMTVRLDTGVVTFRREHAPAGQTESLISIENVIGGGGNDTIIGNGVANKLEGDQGDDVLSGLGGNDYLSGGAGGDTMTGGQGRDVFDCSVLSFSAGTKIDTITDFNTAEDRFDVSGLNMSAGFVATRKVIASASTIQDIYSNVGSLGAHKMQLIDVRRGNQTGLYLFINDSKSAVSSSTDSLVRLQSLTGNIAGACFT